MEYDVHLDTFEGPLDLLLHLVRKTDLEIQEIQVSEITTEYLAYLDTIQNLDLDTAGDFLVMASTLMQIKAKITQEKISYQMDSLIYTEIKAQKNGYVNVTFTAPDTPWLYDILLSFGAQIKILSPAKLKKKLTETAKNISDLYK